MEVPQQVMLSGLYEVTPNWSLMGNVGWQNWSAIGEFPIGISVAKQRTVAANLYFSDTCQIAIGQQFRFGEKWLWSAGFAYDSSPVSRANRVPSLPIDRQLRYGTGIQYQINRDITCAGSSMQNDATFRWFIQELVHGIRLQFLQGSRPSLAYPDVFDSRFTLVEGDGSRSVVGTVWRLQFYKTTPLECVTTFSAIYPPPQLAPRNHLRPDSSIG
jgi:hypothetical protein